MTGVVLDLPRPAPTHRAADRDEHWSRAVCAKDAYGCPRHYPHEYAEMARHRAW